MKIFTSSLLTFLCIFLLSVPTLQANGPGSPSPLDPNSQSALKEIQARFSPLDSAQGDRLLQNLVILAHKENHAPLIPDPTLSVPVEGLQNLDHDRLRQVTVIADRQIQVRQHCDCQCECREELNFWVFFRELIRRGIRIKEIEEERRREEERIRIARSHGDPHIETYDGQNYSFQTVGEYVLSRSPLNGFEIQSRQSRFNELMSLNSAVAMNVRGDRVCYYAQARDIPDGIHGTPIRVNGEPVNWQLEDLALANGGIVKFDQRNNSIQVLWPTGEQVVVTQFTNQSQHYLNIVPLVYPHEDGHYEGLMGNANGDPDDDLKRSNGTQFQSPQLFYSLESLTGKKGVSKSSKEAEKEYQEKLARDFGNTWRVTPATSLFDYAPGKSTVNFTDYFFPRKFLTLGSASPEAAREAQKTCMEAGVTGSALRECMSDVVFSRDKTFAQSSAQVSNPTGTLKKFGLEGIGLPKDRPELSEVEFKKYQKQQKKQRTINPTSETASGKPVSKPTPSVTKPVPPVEKPVQIEPKEKPGSKLGTSLGKVLSGMGSGTSSPTTKPTPKPAPMPAPKPEKEEAEEQIEVKPAPSKQNKSFSLKGR